MFVAHCLITAVCLLYVFESNAYENKIVRSTRPRSANKRPVNVKQYVVKRRPSSVYSVESGNGDNQWKPILDVQSGFPAPSIKHRKHIRPSQKQLPNIIYTTEYYPKQSPQYETADYIANQSLLVSDYATHREAQIPKVKVTKHYQYIPKSDDSNYEVHEQINEESSGYDATQHRFRYQEIPLGKPVSSSVKFAEPVTETHIHHVHYHKPSSSDGRFVGRPHIRKIGLPTSSRRPY